MTKRRQSGYSLVEVLVAMGLFGAVVMAVMTLFYMGRRNVYSGKKMTEGVAIGTKVMEDLSGMTRQGIYDAFKIDDTTPLGTVQTDAGQEGVAQAQYANSIRRATDTISTTTEFGNPTGILSRWLSQLYLTNPANVAAPVPVTTTGANPDTPRFNKGLIEVVLTPSLWTDATRKITTAQILKVRVVVSWNEDQKRRRIIMNTTKAQSF